jgi:hypothetical protein
MSLKKIYLALFGLLTMLILVGLLFFFEDDLNERHVCIKYEEFVRENWKGVVSKKYMDRSNHNAETISFLSQNTYTMFRDDSDFFKFLEIGDSVVKNLNTDTIKVYRKGQQYGFKINFGCDEAIFQ